MKSTVKAHIYSLSGKLDDVVIVEYHDNNHIIVSYDGELHPAIFNTIVGCFYVDDTISFNL